MASNLKTILERCCRLCAEEQEVTIMIFSQEAEALLLQNKLNKYLLIEVDEDDKLPKYICIRCCTKLQSVCEFIDMARQAQEILLKRSLTQEEQKITTTNNCNTTTNVQSEMVSEDETKITQIEVHVDPMVVLQNCEEVLSPNVNANYNNCNVVCVPEITEQVCNLQSADGEYVTIKLIKKAEKPEKNVLHNMHDNTEDDNTGAKPFQCPRCKRSFMTELALKNHSWSHIEEEKLKRYQCCHCDQSFEYKADLMVHLKDHRIQGKCKKCGRVFRTASNLANHMAIHESSRKSYTCKVCGRSYSTRSNLTTHGITHSNARPFHCHICKKSFKRNQDLKFHINQHTGAKPYQCPFCEKCFASSGNCYSHRSRMHPGRRLDGEKLSRRGLTENQTESEKNSHKGIKFQCTLCDHTFIRKDNFTYHMYQHTGMKPFQCTFCSEKFVTRKGLLLHHDKEHPGNKRPLALLSKNALLK